MESDAFWCENNRKYYSRPMFTPILVKSWIVCHEANNDKVFQWQDSSWHWMPEYLAKQQEDWRTVNKTAWKTTVEKKADLRKALEEVCKNVEEQSERPEGALLLREDKAILPSA